MNKKDYYMAFTNKMKSGLEEIGKLNAEHARLSDLRKSGNYSWEYTREVILPQIAAVEQKRKELKAQLERELREINKGFSDELRKMDALKPEEMTDDVKLINSGIKLTERDLRDILERNPDNRTMAQLCFRYAKENDLPFSGRYAPAESQVQELESIMGAACTVLKHADNTEMSNRIYTRIFDGIESTLELS